MRLAGPVSSGIRRRITSATRPTIEGCSRRSGRVISAKIAGTPGGTFCRMRGDLRWTSGRSLLGTSHEALFLRLPSEDRHLKVSARQRCDCFVDGGCNSRRYARVTFAPVPAPPVLVAAIGLLGARPSRAAHGRWQSE